MGGLPADITQETVHGAMGGAGAVLSVRLQLDKTTGKCKGYAFVSFTNPAAAKAACSITEVCSKLEMSMCLVNVLVEYQCGLCCHKGLSLLDCVSITPQLARTAFNLPACWASLDRSICLVVELEAMLNIPWVAVYLCNQLGFG